MKKKTDKDGTPVAYTNPDPVYEKPVKMGAEGKVVAWICRKLRDKGSTIKETEKFNIGVRSAVVSFQKRKNLNPTGIVDKRTWDKLAK